MKYAQETNARKLHQALSRFVKSPISKTTLTISGKGVNWDVIASHDARSCAVHCFDLRGNPEYLVSFLSKDQSCAMGRTHTQDTAVAAVRAWLSGTDLPALHSLFEFVDANRRSLETIRKETCAHSPVLQESTAIELKHIVCDIHELWYRTQDRCCKVSFYGKNAVPDAAFHWDGCRIFSLHTADMKQLAMILTRWLCERIMPSVLHKEFPGLKIEKAASYYEEGRGVEGEFIESWNCIERYYRDEVNLPDADAVRSLLREMRTRGYDKLLRAGQSMYSLILSRSRRHGLRPSQARLKFEFRNNGMHVHPDLPGTHAPHLQRIEFSEDLELLLRKLTTQSID